MSFSLEKIILICLTVLTMIGSVLAAGYANKLATVQVLALRKSL